MRVTVAESVSTPLVELPAGWEGELPDGLAAHLLEAGLAKEAPGEDVPPPAPPRRRKVKDAAEDRPARGR